MPELREEAESIRVHRRTAGITWCYFCGLSDDKCDKADGGGKAIFRHNERWSTNEKRCPMYLNQLCEVDESWPEDDDGCQLKLHTALGKRALRDLQARVPRAELEAAIKHLPSLAAVGFDPLAPVTDEEVHLLTRREAEESDEE